MIAIAWQACVCWFIPAPGLSGVERQDFRPVGLGWGSRGRCNMLLIDMVPTRLQCACALGRGADLGLVSYTCLLLTRVLEAVTMGLGPRVTGLRPYADSVWC